MYKQAKYAIDIAPFIASGVQFTIAVSTCTAFAKTVVAFGINDQLFVQCSQVASSFLNRFTSFYNKWPIAIFY